VSRVTTSWRIASGAAPAVRAWNDEYVVHHALSNDTHRLSEAAGCILLNLINNDPGDPGAVSSEEVQATLKALADLGFLTQC
jgi:hypothetical protein